MATRNFADTALVTMEVATPTADDHAATKAYVDNLVSGVAWKEPVVSCTQTALPANTMTTADRMTADANGALPSIDGITLIVGDRLLVESESTGTKNGIYEVFQVGDGVSPFILDRTSDALAGSDADANAVFCQQGTVSGDTAVVQTVSPATYNGTALVWTTFASVIGGIVTIALAGTATGVSIIDSGTGPTATLRGILGESGVLTATVVTDDVVISIDALGVSTAKLAAQAVTPAKLAPNASLMRIVFTVTFADQGTSVSSSAMLANSRLVSTEVDVTTAFDDVATTIVLSVNAVTVQGATLNDPANVDVYQCDGINEDNVASQTIDAAVGGSANTVGSATVTGWYVVTA